METRNVYDFDGTIYRGDATVDFFFYCLARHPKALLTLPRTACAFALYKLGHLTKTGFKETFFRFLTRVPDVSAAVGAFWDARLENVEPWYLAQKTPSDLVISASPEFLLAPACARLSIPAPIASRVDPRTGQFTGENCRGEEKVRRLRAQYPDCAIGSFYSDSRSDAPLAALACKSFIVRQGRISPW